MSDIVSEARAMLAAYNAHKGSGVRNVRMCITPVQVWTMFERLTNEVDRLRKEGGECPG